MWAGDIALSVTYIPSKRSSYAVLYGCSQELTENVTKRLKSAKNAVCHPMLLPGIFAELECKRHCELVQDAMLQRQQFIADMMKNNKYDWKTRSVDEEDISTTESVDLWTSICDLRNGLLLWRQRLVAMVTHVDELLPQSAGSTPAGSSHGTSRAADAEEIQKLEKAVRDTGILIRERLEVIITEYDRLAAHCNMIMESMSMATQLVSCTILYADHKSCLSAN